MAQNSLNKPAFTRSLRGYSPEEVDAYIDYAIDRYSSVCKENTDLKKKITELMAELREYKNKDSSESREKDRALLEAELIIDRAGETAAQIVNSAKYEAKTIEDANEFLTQRQHQIIMEASSVIADLKDSFDKEYRRNIDALNELLNQSKDCAAKYDKAKNINKIPDEPVQPVNKPELNDSVQNDMSPRNKSEEIGSKSRKFFDASKDSEANSNEPLYIPDKKSEDSEIGNKDLDAFSDKYTEDFKWADIDEEYLSDSAENDEIYKTEYIAENESQKSDAEKAVTENEPVKEKTPAEIAAELDFYTNEEHFDGESFDPVDFISSNFKNKATNDKKYPKG